jgi:hypothetical protein
MAIRANITLTDATPTTPVNRVYYPTEQKGIVLNWVDRTQAISAGQNKLSVSQKSSSKDSPTYKITWKLVCPTLAQTSPSTSTGIQPAPSVAYTNLATLEFVLHERATQQERKDLLAQLRDLIDEAIVTNEVENLDLIW